jgi:hypothetical protein
MTTDCGPFHGKILRPAMMVELPVERFVPGFATALIARAG